MKTITNINVYGLDPHTWETFRAILHDRRQSVSAWAIQKIQDEVVTATITADTQEGT